MEAESTRPRTLSFPEHTTAPRTPVSAAAEPGVLEAPQSPPDGLERQDDTLAVEHALRLLGRLWGRRARPRLGLLAATLGVAELAGAEPGPAAGR